VWLGVGLEEGNIKEGSAVDWEVSGSSEKGEIASVKGGGFLLCEGRRELFLERERRSKAPK